MNNQEQKAPYDVNDVVNNLLDTNAQLTFENAKLKAIIQQLQKEMQEPQEAS